MPRAWKKLTTVFNSSRVPLSKDVKKNGVANSAASVEVPQEVYGLLCLTADEYAPADVDIMAVHGLNGHRIRTWEADNGVMWLRDLVPKSISKARVYTYGYDARTFGSSELAQTSLHDQAVGLVSDLYRRRRVTKSIRRPIIFIAHSLGGLLVKSALIHSQSSTMSHLENHRSIKLSTYAIFFMATPHQGSESADLAKILHDIGSMFAKTNTAFLDLLQQNSVWLQQQQSQFLPISANFKSKFFYEVYKTRTVLGHSTLIVPKTSAVLPGEINAEPIQMFRDHRSIVRFSTDTEDDYLKVVDVLGFMVEEAGSKVADNWEAERDPVIRPETCFIVERHKTCPPRANFVGRDTVVEALKAGLPGRIILHGLGGIGKTQIALHHAYTESYDSVLWLDATNLNRLAASMSATMQALIDTQRSVWERHGLEPDFKHIARVDFRLPESAVTSDGLLDLDLEKTLVVLTRSLQAWLACPGNSRWLVILDNFDNADTMDFSQLIPLDTGSVIVTTRLSDLYADGATYLEVEKMDLQEGVELLSLVSKLPKDENATTLTNKLGGLPLALTQAGSYIFTRRSTFASYLAEFESSRKKLLEAQTTQLFARRNASVFTTWDVSVAACSDDAKTILNICAFLDNDNIDGDVFFNQDKPIASFKVKDPKASLDELVRFSLVKRNGDTFQIHPLVHAWAREKIDKSQFCEFAVLAAGLLVQSVVLVYPLTRANLVKGKRLLAHVLVCVDTYFDILSSDMMLGDNCPPDDLAGRFLSSTLLLSNFLKVYGKTKIAEELFMQYICWNKQRREPFWKAWNPFSLLKSWFSTSDRARLSTYSTGILAKIQMSNRNFEGASTLLRSCIESLTVLDGADSLSARNARAEWAICQHELGRHDEALATLAAVRDGYERDGVGTERILTIRNNMAVILCDIGRYEEAIEENIQLLALKRTHLDNDDPSIMTTIHNLATTHYSNGQYVEAESWIEEVLESDEQIYGNEHLEMAKAQSLLGLIYLRRGEIRQGLEKVTHILSRDGGVPEEVSRALLEAVTDLIHDQPSVAIEASDRVISTFEDLFGRDDKKTLNGCFELGRAIGIQLSRTDYLSYDRDREKIDRAISLVTRALDGRNELLGSRDIDTLYAKYWLFAMTVEKYRRIETIAFLNYLLLRSDAMSKEDVENDRAVALQNLTEVVGEFASLLGGQHSSTLFALDTLKKEIILSRGLEATDDVRVVAILSLENALLEVKILVNETVNERTVGLHCDQSSMRDGVICITKYSLATAPREATILQSTCDALYPWIPFLLYYVGYYIGWAIWITLEVYWQELTNNGEGITLRSAASLILRFLLFILRCFLKGLQ